LSKIFVPSKLSNTLINLEFKERFYTPLSFLIKFTNLQELVLSLKNTETFKILQHAIFPQLQVLSFKIHCPNHNYLTKFLENNGKNLKEFHLHLNPCSSSTNLAIAKFCPNLKSLSTRFKNNDVEVLETILKNCQQLESIITWCWRGDYYLNENKLLEVVAIHSPEKFYELKIRHIGDAKLHVFPKDLEPIFISWSKRIPQKSLSLIIINENRSIDLKIKKENMVVIENFKRLGVIKKFEIVLR